MKATAASGSGVGGGVFSLRPGQLGRWLRKTAKVFWYKEGRLGLDFGMCHYSQAATSLSQLDCRMFQPSWGRHSPQSPSCSPHTRAMQRVRHGTHQQCFALPACEFVVIKQTCKLSHFIMKLGLVLLLNLKYFFKKYFYTYKLHM